MKLKLITIPLLFGALLCLAYSSRPYSFPELKHPHDLYSRYHIETDFAKPSLEFLFQPPRDLRFMVLSHEALSNYISNGQSLITSAAQEEVHHDFIASIPTRGLSVSNVLVMRNAGWFKDQGPRAPITIIQKFQITVLNYNDPDIWKLPIFPGDVMLIGLIQ